MKKGITSSGFKYSINEENLDDWNFLKVLKEIDNGEIQRIVDFVPMLLGEKQARQLEKYLEKKEGKVRISSVSREIEEILASSSDLKN